MKLGMYNDGSGKQVAIGNKEEDGNGYKVTVFPEPGGQYDVHHNVPEGTENGQFKPA